ncbi:MAG: energy transducer TonB [Gammaproteobacteria bacterium]
MLISKPLSALSRALVTAACVLALYGPSLVAAQDKAPQPPPANTSPSVAVPTPAPAVRPPANLKVKLTTLEEWDTQMDILVRLTQQVYAGQAPQDLGGHDLQYYWQQYVFGSATKDNLDNLREKAQKQSVAKDTAGLQHTLDEASAIISAEHAKMYAVTMFLTAQAPVVYHQYQLGPWLVRATDADRQGINDRVTSTYEYLAKELDEAVKQPDLESLDAISQRFYKQIAAPVAFFNAERARMVKAQANLPNPVAVASLKRGDQPCPAAVPPVKGRDKPGLGTDFPSSETFYPPSAKQNDVEGAVTVRVAISETGCVTSAEVAGTSGVAELDEGALKLAMAGKYAPGAGAGDKPVAGSLTFRVKFEQPDAFGAGH